MDAEAVDGADLEAGCFCATGQGYRIEYQGLPRRPCRVVFGRPLDLAAFLGELPALGELARQARDMRRRMPGLAGWVRGHPQQVLGLVPHWPELMGQLEQRLAAQRGFDDSIILQGGDTPDPAQQTLLAELLEVLRTSGPDTN